MDRIHKKLLLQFEDFILRSADYLVANTQTHAEQLLRRGYSNVEAIRNSFDPEDFSGIDVMDQPVLTIAHVGSIYGNRKPDILFAAINKLEKEYAPNPLKIRVLFVGLGANTLRDKVAEYDVVNYVSVESQVPHRDALAAMCSAHLLLLIKATGKWSKGQIPGKFFEYVGSGTPVLCIGPKESEVASLIQDHDLGYVVEDDLTEMTAILRRVYEQFKQDGRVPELQEAQVKPFAAETMVRKICTILEAG
jgi:glycosyltransferase involved in cell wall biosynthesis